MGGLKPPQPHPLRGACIILMIFAGIAWESWANFEKLSSITTGERKEFECKNKLIDAKTSFAF